MTIYTLMFKYKSHSIIFIALELNTFLNKDLEILSAELDVKPIVIKHNKGVKYLLNLIYLSIRILVLRFRGVAKVYIAFADYHSFIITLLSQIFRLKVFVRVGGFELNEIPEIGYGGRIRRIRKFCIDYTLRHCYLALPVAKDLCKRAAELKGTKDGIFYLPNGYRKDVFKWTKPRKNKKVLVVASISDERTFILKGIDFVLNCAEVTPEFNYTIAGVSENIWENKYVPQNIQTLSYLNRDQLIEQYSTHRYLFIPSQSEGMPNVLGESLFCGCIAIGTSVGDIPELINNSKLQLSGHSLEEYKNALNYAESISDEDVLKNYNRIVSQFSYEKRKETLTSILTSESRLESNF